MNRDPSQCVPWDEWQDPFRPLTPVAAHAPTHEPEPGLLDEEVLPLFWDWERGFVHLGVN